MDATDRYAGATRKDESGGVEHFAPHPMFLWDEDWDKNRDIYLIRIERRRCLDGRKWTIERSPKSFPAGEIDWEWVAKAYGGGLYKVKARGRKGQWTAFFPAKKGDWFWIDAPMLEMDGSGELTPGNAVKNIATGYNPPYEPCGPVSTPSPQPTEPKPAALPQQDTTVLLRTLVIKWLTGQDTVRPDCDGMLRRLEAAVRAAKTVREDAALDAKAVREDAARDAKAVREDAARDAKAVREDAALDAMSVREAAALDARAEREEAARDARAEREAAEARRRAEAAEELLRLELRLEAERLAKSAAPDAVTTLLRTAEVLRGFSPPANPFEQVRSALALAKELAPPPAAGLSEIAGVGRFFRDVVGTLAAAGKECSSSSPPAAPSVPMGQYNGVTLPLAQVLALQQQDLEQQAAEVLRIKEEFTQRLTAHVAAAQPAALATPPAAPAAEPPASAQTVPTQSAAPPAAPPAPAQATPTTASPASAVPAPASPEQASADHGAVPVAVAQFSAPARAERAVAQSGGVPAPHEQASANHGAAPVAVAQLSASARAERAVAQPGGAPAPVAVPAKVVAEPAAKETSAAPPGASPAPAGLALVSASENHCACTPRRVVAPVGAAGRSALGDLVARGRRLPARAQHEQVGRRKDLEARRRRAGAPRRARDGVGGRAPARPRRSPGGVPAREGGLLAPERVVARSIPFDRIEPNLERGLFDPLTVSTTHVSTGRTVVYVQRRDATLPQWSHDPTTIARAARIGARHALMSAAIPTCSAP